MKKKKIILTTIILIFILLIPLSSFASSNQIQTLSQSCILIDSSTGKILYEKDSKKRKYPASTTKMMTAILTLEKCNLTDIATVNETAISKEAVPDGYTNAKLVAGEKFTIEQLLNVLLIPSANDAANVLAEHISGSVEEFSKLMNEKAKEIGCLDTNFVNPSGIHNDNHYSTAYDLSLIAQYGMKNETFRNIVCKTSCKLPTTDKYLNDDREFNTTNELLKDKKNNTYNYYYEYANGIKTGYTEYANNCLASSAKKDDKEFICVILGADDTGSKQSKRAIDSINLFNFAFENYNEKKFLSKETIIKQIQFDVKNDTDSEKKSLDIVPEKDLNVLTTTAIDEITPIVTINENINTPILKGSIVGTIEYDIDDEHYSINLIANNDIIDSSYIQYVFDILFIILLIILFLSVIKLKHKHNKKYSFDYKKL